MGHARALLGVDDPDTQRSVARSVMEHSLSVRETEKAIKRIITGANTAELTVQNVKKDDANIRAAETRLRRHFGTQVRVLPGQSGKGGKIEIEYYNEGDLDRIYQLLMRNYEEAQVKL